MAFTMEKFQNQYLPVEGRRADAILRVTAGDEAGTQQQDRVFGFIIDQSGSMAGERIRSVTQAASQAVNLLDASSTFFIVTFNTDGHVLCAPARATPEQKQQAANQLRRVEAEGGTAMSEGLTRALQVFAQYPRSICYAIFLTDGKNESETPVQVQQVLQQCQGVFQADCWGVGTDWKVGEVQEIARTLLGKAALIPQASGIALAFQEAIGQAQSKTINNVRLRLWTPATATVIFVKQVNPKIEDLTGRAAVTSPQVREYPTGAWGRGEAREYHISIELTPGNVGVKMMAGRPSIVYEERDPSGATVTREIQSPDGRILAEWTADDTLSSRIDRHVAAVTGNVELADSIQQGLAMKEKGDDAAATQFLGRAVKLSIESGNEEMTHRLSKVVDILDPEKGTVRLRKAAKADEMDLQLESTTTKRVKRAPTPPPTPSGT